MTGKKATGLSRGIGVMESLVNALEANSVDMEDLKITNDTTLGELISIMDEENIRFTHFNGPFITEEPFKMVEIYSGNNPEWAGWYNVIVSGMALQMCNPAESSVVYNSIKKVEENAIKNAVEKGLDICEKRNNYRWDLLSAAILGEIDD